MNAPATREGWGLWDLVQSSTGQFRYHDSSGSFLGFDMAAVLALGRAKGLKNALMAEFLPDLEVAVSIALHKKKEGYHG